MAATCALSPHPPPSLPDLRRGVVSIPVGKPHRSMLSTITMVTSLSPGQPKFLWLVSFLSLSLSSITAVSGNLLKLSDCLIKANSMTWGAHFIASFMFCCHAQQFLLNLFLSLSRRNVHRKDSDGRPTASEVQFNPRHSPTSPLECVFPHRLVAFGRSYRAESGETHISTNCRTLSGE